MRPIYALAFFIAMAQSVSAQLYEQHYSAVQSMQTQAAGSAAMLRMQHQMQQQAMYERAMMQRQAMMLQQQAMMQQAFLEQELQRQRELQDSIQRPAVASETTGVVERVIDGDTVQLRDGRKVRLHGIDAPERDQKFGLEAKRALEKSVLGKSVRVEAISKSFDRIVARVTTSDGESVGQDMVARGFAWHDSKYAPDDKNLADAQEDAKLMLRGLWINPDPQSPAEFREKSGSLREPFDLPKQKSAPANARAR